MPGLRNGQSIFTSDSRIEENKWNLDPKKKAELLITGTPDSKRQLSEDPRALFLCVNEGNVQVTLNQSAEKMEVDFLDKDGQISGKYRHIQFR